VGAGWIDIVLLGQNGLAALCAAGWHVSGLRRGLC
jgi:hypothetical protein